MNDAPQAVPATAARAQALAEINKMQTDLIEAHGQIERLTRELRNQQDRVSLLMEERERFRNEARLYNKKLIELATAVSNIGLLTRTAEDVMRTIEEMEEEMQQTTQQAAPPAKPQQQRELEDELGEVLAPPRAQISAPRPVPRGAQS